MPNCCCVLKRCKNSYSKMPKNVGISYHTFPSDSFMKHKWIFVVQADRNEYDWRPTKNSTICSEHFTDEDKYITYKGYMRLKKTAVPVIVPELVPQEKYVDHNGHQKALEDRHSFDSRHSTDSCSETILTLKRKIKEDYDLVEGQDDGIPINIIMKRNDLEHIDASVPNLSSASYSQTSTVCESPTRELHIETQNTMDVTAIKENPGSPLSDVVINSDAADSPEEQAIKIKLRQKMERLNKNEEILKRRREEASFLEKKHKELLADIKYLQDLSKKKIKSFDLNEL